MISAIILAAGESKRMGQPKMLLPWGDKTILTHVISIFQNAGLEDIIVVTGGAREKIEKLVSGCNVRTVFNKEFKKAEMLSSIQYGIQALTSQTQAVLIGLGDQPQVQDRSVRMVCETFVQTKSSIVIPSYQMRRGHPWLVERSLWKELLKSKTPRDFLNRHPTEIQYISVKDPNILADIDTPEEYQKWTNKFHDKLAR